jgi:hypothetical protein
MVTAAIYAISQFPQPGQLPEAAGSEPTRTSAAG